ncbi:MAG: M48 family metallopeptidase [Chloroflexi bacterium]|nr:M48 family metallopeptidase [Chloroflexota bacterium]
MAGKPEIVRRIPDGPHTLSVTVSRDRRLRKSARWTLNEDTIHVRVPDFTTAEQLDKLLDDITARVLKQRARSRHRNDAELERRAREINRQYFDNELRWHTIRWVSNMQRRLGSCTHGGTTDGDIRISDRIQHWPTYVVDYILAHELAHRKHPNHSPAFWDYLSRFPHTERARGFIEGVAYAQGEDPDDLI